MNKEDLIEIESVHRCPDCLFGRQIINKKWRCERHRREYRRKYKKVWRESRLLIDPLFKIKKLIRGNIYHAIKNKGFSKKSKTADILGCNYKFLYGYLMITFYNNYNRLPTDNDQLHIDHIIPLATAKTEVEVLKLNHYTNLQWLLASDNLKKGNRYNQISKGRLI